MRPYCCVHRWCSVLGRILRLYTLRHRHTTASYKITELFPVNTAVTSSSRCIDQSSVRLPAARLASHRTFCPVVPAGRNAFVLARMSQSCRSAPYTRPLRRAHCARPASIRQTSSSHGLWRVAAMEQQQVLDPLRAALRGEIKNPRAAVFEHIHRQGVDPRPQFFALCFFCAAYSSLDSSGCSYPSLSQPGLSSVLSDPLSRHLPFCFFLFSDGRQRAAAAAFRRFFRALLPLPVRPAPPSHHWATAAFSPDLSALFGLWLRRASLAREGADGLFLPPVSGPVRCVNFPPTLNASSSSLDFKGDPAFRHSHDLRLVPQPLLLRRRHWTLLLFAPVSACRIIYAHLLQHAVDLSPRPRHCKLDLSAAF